MKYKITLIKIDLRLVNAGTISFLTLTTVTVTIISIWLTGLEENRSLFTNSILSTTVLSSAFFLFLSVGLYRGIKLKDDLGKITDKFEVGEPPNVGKSVAESITEMPLEDIADAEGCAGIIIGIIAWLLFSGLILLFLWVFGAVMWAMTLIFAAMLYWIFFRALRLVFKNSNRCKGDLKMSLVYGFSYTVLYNFWIYGIILGAHYIR
jgi:hypothetical protein